MRNLEKVFLTILSLGFVNPGQINRVEIGQIGIPRSPNIRLSISNVEAINDIKKSEQYIDAQNRRTETTRRLLKNNLLVAMNTLYFSSEETTEF